MWEVPKMESLGVLAISIWIVVLSLLKYIFFRTGLLAMSFLPVSLFVRASSIDPETSNLIAPTTSDVTKALPQTSSITEIKNLIPDVEIMALASPLVENARDYVPRFPTVGIASLYPTLLQPKSHGSVRLASANPFDKPKIDLGYFSDPADFPTARKAVRLALKCAAAMKAQGFPIIRAHDLPDDPDDDESVDDFIKKKLRSAYHYTSTCRMAAEDDPCPGVVDDELRVHGVGNLRVADASVFPNVLATHMQAPTVMVAERCADFVRREWAKGGE
jgi:choline dehydrogenase